MEVKSRFESTTSHHGPFGPPLVFLLAACSTSPLTGRSQFMVVSERMAVSQSAAAYSQMMGQLNKKKQIETCTPRRSSQSLRTDPRYSDGRWRVARMNGSSM